MEHYILNHIDEQPAVLYELERYTHLNLLRPRMLSGHLQGTVLKMICRMVSPLSVLEIGTFTGYSTICMAMGMPLEGHIHTVEKNDELEHIINMFFQKAGISSQVTLHIGSVLNVIHHIPDMFDLVFIDGDKREYPQYLEMVFSKLKVNGFILADNIFWDGKVTKPNMPDDNYTKGIMEFNDMVKNDSRLEKTIIPLRDGLLLARKIRD